MIDALKSSHYESRMVAEVKLAKELLDATPHAFASTGNDIWGLILGDKIAFYRRRNAMKLSKRLQEEAEKLGGKIDPQRVPDQFAFEWGESATKKSDETIQDMFVRLLTNAATEGGSTDERLIYALREMSGGDAILFRALYSDSSFRHLWRDRGVQANSLVHYSKESLKIEAELALDNLLRLSLVREMTGLVDESRLSRSLADFSGRPNIKFTTQRLIRPSALGILLYQQVYERSASAIVSSPSETANSE
jgi:hypothetical protein